MNDPQLEEIIRQLSGLNGNLKWLNGSIRGIGLILFILMATVVCLVIVGLRQRP